MTSNVMRSLRAAMLILPAAFLVAGCSKGEGPAAGASQQNREAAAFPVETKPVESRTVEYTVTAVGSLDAFERVEVTARVAGAVERVGFSEGQVVGSGQALVDIEPERYRLAVAAAQASTVKAQASRAEAEAGFTRRQQASEKNPGLIRGEEVETWRTKMQTAAAEVSQAQAALAQAKLNLRDAFVRAPVPGIIQTRTVRTGQYVQPGTVLATLLRRDPLLLRFQIPEQDATAIRPGMNAIFNVGESTQESSAKITYVAGAASSTSRMVDVTAQVVNPNRPELRPGAFARVRVPIGARRDAPVIPQTAIRPSERGFLAFVINGDIAEQRVLTIGMRTADGQVEVTQGLKPGETLVVRGAEALRDGAKVTVSK